MAEVAPVLYWELFIVHVAIWEILRWQRNDPESPAATWFRRFLLAKSFVWLTLAVGRTLFQEWLIVGYATVVLYVVFAATAAVLALIWTYIVPVIRCRGGRCVQATVPPLDGGLYPKAWNVDRDGERRSGRERRRNWPHHPSS